MAAATVDLGKQSGVVQRRDIFQCDEFHGLAMPGFRCFLGDQYTDHRDALTDELMYVRGGYRSQLFDLFAIEGQGVTAGEKAERLDFMGAFLRSRIIVGYWERV